MSDEKSRVAWLVSGALASTRDGGIHPVDGCSYRIAVDARDLDDCAVLEIQGEADVVIGTDYVRGPRFLLYEKGFLSGADIGRFLVTANVSDLAAMGAAPVGMLAVVRYPSAMDDSEFQAVMRGIDEGCAAYSIRLIGGDTGSAERLILSGSAVGLVARGRSLTRNRAEPGDAILVTGPLGGAGAAVLAADAKFVEGLDPAAWKTLLDCWKLPNAQPKAGQALAKIGFRVTCQDVSDGLRATVREIGERNNLSAVLFEEAIPLHPGVKAVAEAASVDPVGLGISASTDFCLCVSCNESHVDAVLEAVKESGAAGTVIGRLEPGEGVWLESKNRGREVAPGVEWRHQAGEIATTIIGGLRSK